MTPARIAELKALAAAATSGPWRFEPWSDTVRSEGWIKSDALKWGSVNCCSPGDGDGTISGEDGRFIAAARTALPEALAALERVRAVAPCAHYFGNGTFCGRAKAHAVHVPFDGDPDRHAFAFPHWLTAALEGTNP